MDERVSMFKLHLTISQIDGWMDDAQTQNLGLVIDTLGMHKKTQHFFCVWAAPRCVWPSTDTSWLGNWAVREKRSGQ